MALLYDIAVVGYGQTGLPAASRLGHRVVVCELTRSVRAAQAHPHRRGDRPDRPCGERFRRGVA
ncbi:hypothetical protein ACRJ4B_10085 [Streptomyces sp. GTA36]